MEDPIVSVIMPVYNGELFLSEAIDSVLGQTFDSFELIIIDDGSTDRTQEVVMSYKDPRIKYLLNDRNRRIVYSLNRGLDCAKGKYIARMDADDICFPARLERQVDYMEQHPDVGLCATGVVAFGGFERLWKYPESHEEISCHLFFYCCMAHPTVMFRKDLFVSKNLRYSTDMKEAEDYELWARSSKIIRLANLGEPLLYYRVHDKQGTMVNVEGVSNYRDEVRRSQLKHLKIDINESEFELHKLVCSGVSKYYNSDGIMFDDRESQMRWIDYLVNCNDDLGAFSKEDFRKILLNYRQKLELTSSMISNFLESSKTRPFYIWGTGAQGRQDLKILVQEGIEIAGLFDNNPANWGSTFEGKPIHNPALLDTIDRPFIIISSVYRDEIAVQLLSFGLRDNINFIRQLS